MKSEPFVVLVSDRDATVGIVSAMLLSSALATQRTTFDARVRVLVEPEIITGLEAPELPEEIRKIEEVAVSASTADIENANLIVAFSGMDLVKIKELREKGVAAPAVNLCQFVDNLAEDLQPAAFAKQKRATTSTIGSISPTRARVSRDRCMNCGPKT